MVRCALEMIPPGHSSNAGMEKSRAERPICFRVMVVRLLYLFPGLVALKVAPQSG